jgi:hypothetical protein
VTILGCVLLTARFWEHLLDPFIDSLIVGLKGGHRKAGLFPILFWFVRLLHLGWFKGLVLLYVGVAGLVFLDGPNGVRLGAGGSGPPKRVWRVVVRGLALAMAMVVGLLTAGIAVIWWSECRLKARINFITFSRIDQAQKLSTGEGVKVAICDWLFAKRGPATNKYVEAASMIPGESVGADKPWHGEWMAELVHQTAPACKIIPIRAMTTKEDRQQYLVKGIRFAADHGAVAVTSSMGPLILTDELIEAVDYAEKKGTLFVNVHPIGRYGRWEERKAEADETDRKMLCTGVVSVPWRHVRPERGRDVYVWPYSLTPTYLDGWGLSVGPPIVAGVIALMKSANPSLTPQQMREIIVKTAYVKDGFRVLDAEAAVNAARQGKCTAE